MTRPTPGRRPVLLGTRLSILAVRLDDIAFRRHARVRHLALLTPAGIVESLGDRPITAWGRVQAIREYWRGQTAWGEMARRGLSRA